MPAYGRQRAAGSALRSRIGLSSSRDTRSRGLWRLGWQAVCRAACRWRTPRAGNGFRYSDHSPRRDRERAHLCWLRGRLSVCLRPGRNSSATDERFANRKDPQPLDGSVGRWPLRLVYELRRLRRNECESTRAATTAANAMGAAVGRHRQTCSCMWRRATVHAHRRRANHRGRARHRATAVAPSLARCIPVFHFAVVRPGKAARAASRHQAFADALPGRSNGRTAVGGSLHRFAKLEPPVPTRRAWQDSNLCLELGGIRGTGNREGVHVQRRTSSPTERARSDELDLFQRQSILPQRPSPLDLGLGSRHRQSGLGKGFFRVWPRRE